MVYSTHQFIFSTSLCLSWKPSLLLSLKWQFMYKNIFCGTKAAWILYGCTFLVFLTCGRGTECAQVVPGCLGCRRLDQPDFETPGLMLAPPHRAAAPGCRIEKETPPLLSGHPLLVLSTWGEFNIYNEIIWSQILLCGHVQIQYIIIESWEKSQFYLDECQNLVRC